MGDLTALMLAATGGHVRCCELLLDAKADPDAASEDSGGRTALHLAAYEPHVEVVRMLLQAGADRSICCASGETATEVAALRAKVYRQGGGDGEEDIDALEEVMAV